MSANLTDGQKRIEINHISNRGAMLGSRLETKWLRYYTILGLMGSKLTKLIRSIVVTCGVLVVSWLTTFCAHGSVTICR